MQLNMKAYLIYEKSVIRATWILFFLFLLNVILILQVIFLALDELVKNVVSTYSLEHKSIDDLFDSVFNCLDVLDKEGKDNHKTFQGLLFCIGTIQTTIYQHMLKEEEQVSIVLVICI